MNKTKIKTDFALGCEGVNTYKSAHQQTGHCSEGSGKCSGGQSSKEIHIQDNYHNVEFEEYLF